MVDNNTWPTSVTGTKLHYILIMNHLINLLIKKAKSKTGRTYSLKAYASFLIRMTCINME